VTQSEAESCWDCPETRESCPEWGLLGLTLSWVGRKPDNRYLHRDFTYMGRIGLSRGRASHEGNLVGKLERAVQLRERDDMHGEADV
jgi:hypothetical protein